MPSRATAGTTPSVDAIKKLFDIEDWAAGRRYLVDRPFLVPLLVEARQRVSRYFPDQLRIGLQLLVDRDDWRHVVLFAVIRTALPEDDALRRLDRFDEEWWLKAGARASGQLTIDVESVS